jgi:16S rRNA (cytosine967-C5)-methyltransferase
LRPKTPRGICLEILNRAGEGDRPLDALLSDSFKRYRHLTPIDRAFLTELTYGTFRWRGKLDWVVRQFSKIPLERVEFEILNVLRIGLYQILFLSRTPTSAAVNEAAELGKKFRGKGGAAFVNAILRSILRQRETIPYPEFGADPALHISVMQSHPLWLVQRWVEELGAQEALRICVANNQIAPLTLRINSLKGNRSDLMAKLVKEGLDVLPTPFSEDGIVLRDPPPTSELPFLNHGLYIIQDEASQGVSLLLDPRPGETILDVCAAPGGKTTHIAQRMNDQGEIYAVDLSRERLRFVEESCSKLGITIVKSRKGDATRPLPVPDGLKFDRILTDVPCSGFGTLRRNPDLKWRKGENDIRRLSRLQLAILKNASSYLKAEGVLVYSTCTVFHEENEDVVDAFLRDCPEFHLDSIEPMLPPSLRSLASAGTFKTFPPKDEMDGFFAARIIKWNGERQGRKRTG